MTKVRIDKLLVDKGLVVSREKGQALIMAGCVLVNEVPVTKAGQLISPEANIRIQGEDHSYVGRGGLKLEHALKEFKIDVNDMVCVDVGASTGGFTDCLLQHGAKKIYAIDVGYGQLAWKLRNDPKVVVMERTNIRNVIVTHTLPPQEGGGAVLPEFADIAVVDVSFISLEKVLPHIDKLIHNDSSIVALIKPQFEVGRENVGKGGIVRDPALHEGSIKKVCDVAKGLGWDVKGVIKSPITGADGNLEFLAWFVK